MSPSLLYGITGPQLSNPSCLESYGSKYTAQGTWGYRPGFTEELGRGHPCDIKYRAVSGTPPPIAFLHSFKPKLK